MRVHKIVHSYLKQFVTKVTKHELKRKKIEDSGPATTTILVLLLNIKLRFFFGASHENSEIDT